MQPTFFQDEEGITCAYLAASGPRWHHRAVALLTAKPQAGDVALWTSAANITHLAFAHAQAGDGVQACVAALEASGAVKRTGSARHAAMLGQIHAGLAARWPKDPRVAELADALR